MLTKKNISRCFKNLNKYRLKEKNAAAEDNIQILIRECGNLKNADSEFIKYGKSGEFTKAFNKISEICEEGLLPSVDDFIIKYQPEFLSVKQNKYLCDTIKYCLLGKFTANTNNKTLTDNIIKSIFILKDYDFGKITKKLCMTDIIFRGEKAGVYPFMSDSTRSLYLLTAEKEAKRKKIPTEIYANKIVKQADEKNVHIGFILPIEKDNSREGKALIIISYIIAFLTSLFIAYACGNILLSFVIILPVTDIFIKLMLQTSAKRKKPSDILRMDKSVVYDNPSTAVAISTVMPKACDIKSVEEHLKKIYLANKKSINCVCLLADLPSDKNILTPADEENIRAAMRMTDRLNLQMGDKFTLAVRERVYSQTEREYTARERKRGAVITLSKFVSTGENDFKILHGAKHPLANSEYLMLLDSDTQIGFDELSSVIAAAIHPLNKAVTDELSKTVKSGYGIFAPNAAASVKSFSRTYFSRDMCGEGGTSAYNNKTNDFYFDFFANGIFCGKGLIHAKTFYKAIEDRFPDEKILSHDILEGIILRVLPITDITLTDDFPKTENAYFKRANRWIRGDIQNTPFLRKKTLNRKNTITPPFKFDGKYKLFDNIRRAVTPVAVFLGIILSIFFNNKTALTVCGICLLSTVTADLISGIYAVFSGGSHAVSRLYKADTLPPGLSSLIRAVLKISQIGIDAVNSADAVIRSLWRMHISKKHLLSWTTAAAADKSSGFLSVLIPRIPTLIVSVFLFLSKKSILILCGIMFVFDVFYAFFSQKEIKNKKVFPKSDDITYIRREEAYMWKFFYDNFKSEYGYLPPDNISISPLPETAERTSPTNIGLALCVYLSARDMGFIDSKTLYTMLDKTVSTIEKLEKWNGNLINWYDIKNQKALSPKYASFVDSGNFICCITALKEGLFDYINEEERLSEIAVRLEKIKNECNLSAFYNKNRRLFSIGYNIDNNSFSASYYDLLMSEARMASFAAVAFGEASSEHWFTLSRTMSKCGRYSGALSWSGTMFEYFMPYIFLPSYKNTLTDESLWFCLKSQMRYAEKNKIPWGISESCYYSFNDALNYSYKANGVAAAALNKCDEDNLTVSAYSSFLTLPFAVKEAITNLKRLEKYPIKGKYGFYEAIDFNKERKTGKNPSVVRCFMVHHLGMSLLSCENALGNMIWQKRFMKNLETNAAQSLLREKVPTEIYRNNKETYIGCKDERFEKQPHKSAKDVPAAIYESGGLVSAFHKSGCADFTVSGVKLFRKNENIINYPCGIFAAVNIDDAIIPFTAEPNELSGVNCKSVFGKSYPAYYAEANGIKLEQRFLSDRNSPCITVKFKIKNMQKKPLNGKLSVYCEPSLTSGAQETAHRAYSKLFIKSRRSDKANCVIFERSSEKENAAIAMGFIDAAYDFTTDRDSVLPINGSIRNLFSKNNELNNRTGNADCCFYASSSFSVGAKKELEFCYITAYGKDSEEAERGFLNKTVNNDNFSENCKLFVHNSTKDMLGAMILCDTLFQNKIYLNREEYLKNRDSSINMLWSLGISGDNPIIVLDCDKTEPSAIKTFTDVIKGFNSAGLKVDLAVIYNTDTEYGSKKTNRIADLCDINGMGNGIYLINKTTVTDKTLNVLYAYAAAIYPTDTKQEANEVKPIYTLPSYNPDSKAAEDTEKGFFIPTPPPVPWCGTLSNKSFGCLVSDRGLGFTWCMNSSENKLTPWTNDPHSDTAGEILTVFSNDRHYDITLDAAANIGGNCAEWYSHDGDCCYTTVVSVPEKGMRKDIYITIENKATASCTKELFYTVTPIMGRTANNGRFVISKERDGGIVFFNTMNKDFSGFLFIKGDNAVYENPVIFRRNAGISKGVSAVIKLCIPQGEKRTAHFSMSYAMKETAAVKLCELKLPKQSDTPQIIKCDKKETNILVNKYLIHQTERTRIYSRCAFYQAGGAFGFRDQLQDCINMVKIKPELLKYQIYRSAASQFEQGDVLHWWHIVLKNGKQEKRGIRTRCSDDLLWLPYAVGVYTQETGDSDIIAKRIPFVSGEILKSDETEKYFITEQTQKKASVYEHCIKAIEKAYAIGPHGLLLIGSGDWNDSFNNMGLNGKGESVWLTQFYIMTLKKFIPIIQLKKDFEKARKYEEIIEKLYENIDEHAWNNNRYIRAFYDDGTPMGAENSGNSEIDLLPQCFASLCDMPNKERVRTALMTAFEKLYDREERILKLFSPPFDEQAKPTGYVNYYPKGVRENGGQYTHAAVWALKALYKEGFKEEATELFDALNPLLKLEQNNLTGMYRNEPYALSADVYALKNYKGRAGWSHYTGAAGWLLSTAIEMYGDSGKSD